jgi:HEAT repeat protein
MPSYVKTAYYGDLASLKQEIGKAKAARTINQDSVLALARAVARREVRSASGDTVVERIRSTRACVRAVEPELRERAESNDDAGAEALLLLVESGRANGEPLVARYARSDQGAFRAVAARGTSKGKYADVRRSFFVDGDERVRQAAFRAAFEAKDPVDTETLLEAARLDPSPQNRSLAARAVGRAGGPRAVLGLRDVWATAEAPVRLAIVDAWSMPGVFAEGGERELLQIAEARDSLSSVAAAGALARTQGEGAAVGRAVVLRAIVEGTNDERLVAIQLARLDDKDAIVALDHAATEKDGPVRVAAWVRLLQDPPHRLAAFAQLREAAKGHDAASRQALMALADSEDPAVTPLLVNDLSGVDPGAREQAALGLFRLGHPSDMAATLADSDPDVRLSVACSLLAADAPHAG